MGATPGSITVTGGREMKFFEAVRRRLTYANITATLALILAAGGTSYAAFKLPHHSVGSAQLKRGAVHAVNIAKGQIGLRHLGPSARALAGSTGVPGPAGPQGPAGPKGDTGPGVTAWATLNVQDPATASIITGSD